MRKLLTELQLEAGKVSVYQLKGRDIRELMRMSKDVSGAELPELAALKSTCIDGKDLTMDMLDDMSASDYLAILKAQEANFTVMTPAAG